MIVQLELNPISHGGVFRTPSNFAASTGPRNVKNIGIFYGDFSSELQKEYFCPVSGFSTKNVRIMYLANLAII